MKTCLSLLLLCITYTHGWEETIYGNITIIVEEASGTIIIKNGVNEISVAFREIVEVDRFGNSVGLDTTLRHTYSNFKYANFIASPTEFIEIEAYDKNITAIRKNFTTTLVGPAADFDFQVLMYDNSTLVPSANSTEYYTVYNGTMKFAFQITGWPFCGMKGFHCENKSGRKEIGHYLDIFVAIMGKKEPVLTYERSRTSWGEKPSTYDYGGGDVTFSHKYNTNNTWFQMERGYPKLTRKNNENMAIIRFPAFYTSAYYDPMVNISSNVYISSAISLMASSCFSVIGVMILTLIFLLSV